MQNLIFDTHSHYTAHQFKQDCTQLLDSLQQNGVALVVDCGTDLATSQQSLLLAEKYPWFYTTAGIHPQSLIDKYASTVTKFNGDWKSELKEIEKLFSHPKLVAIGEIGLDHHWPVPQEEQLLLFETQIKLGIQHNLPLVLHDREAHAEMYALLKKYKPKAVMHSYSGSADDAVWLAKQGLYFGFNGVVTFKNARKPLEAAAAVPLERLLLETDCPYMAPVPYRGTRSDSAMISKIAEIIADARGLTTEEVLAASLENGKRLFGI